MLSVALILCGAIFTIASCWAAGAILLDALQVTLAGGERLFFRFCSGAACFSLLIFAFTAAGLAYQATFLASGAVLIALALWKHRGPADPWITPDYSRVLKWALAAVFAVYGVFYFVNGLAPEYSPDGSSYHLGLVARYLRQHGFGRITTDMYASLSQGIEMLFLSAFSIGRHSAAALVEFTFLLALPLGMLAYARRFGITRAGAFAAILIFASPMFGVAGASAYIDVAGTCIVFAVFYALQLWLETRQPGLIPVLGLLAGFTYAVKYTLVIALPLTGLILFFSLLRAKRPLVRPLAVFSACAVLMFAPWMVKNAITVGNPLAPFFNSWFPNPNVTIGFETGYRADMFDRDVKLPERPLAQIQTGRSTAGFLGPVFWIAPIALLALRFAAGRRLLLFALVLFLPAIANTQTRFLMPSLPFLSLAIGMALEPVPLLIAALAAFHVIASWPSVSKTYVNQYAWRWRDFPWQAALRLTPERTFLLDRSGLATAELIDRFVPPRGRVLSFDNPPEAYSEREILVVYESATGQKLANFFYCAANPDLRPERFLKFAFPAQSVLGLRVVQTATHKTDYFSVNEFRIYSGGQEVPRHPGWRISAWPNPWDAGLAFDNDPITRWSSVQTLYPGMWIQLEMQPPERADLVVLQTAHDQWGARFRLEAETAPGVWRPVAGDPVVMDLPQSVNLRRDAVLAMRRYGITHLLITRFTDRFADIQDHPELWGVTLRGSYQNNFLYSLDP